jgi:hypothetical protein
MISRIPPDEVNKMDAIVLALEEVGGGSKRVDTEDVAVAAYNLAPNYFSWRKYREHIDLDAVRVALRHATERGYGSRVGGSIKAGWHLTARGAQWLQEHGSSARRSLGAPHQERPSHLEANDGQQAKRDRELVRLRRTEAYEAWKRGNQATPRAAAAVFRIDAYTPHRDRTFLTAQLTSMAERAGDKELTSFLAAMERIALEYEIPSAKSADAQIGGGTIDQDQRPDRRS